MHLLVRRDFIYTLLDGVSGSELQPDIAGESRFGMGNRHATARREGCRLHRLVLDYLDAAEAAVVVIDSAVPVARLPMMGVQEVRQPSITRIHLLEMLFS
ncbi:unnamed protein product [Linum trigynum]|uniref:Uncharacterized protein n=1 Tax=Linum trigynum TaxID=586398 RepID=A0AAV2FDB7_9ROSI